MHHLHLELFFSVIYGHLPHWHRCYRAFHLFYQYLLFFSSWHEGMSRLTLILTMAGAPCTYLGHNKASCGAMRNCIDSSTSWKFSLAAGTSGSENQDRSCFHQPRLSSEPTVCPSGDWTLSDVCLKVSEAGWKNFWHFLPSNNFLSPKKHLLGPHPQVHYGIGWVPGCLHFCVIP